MFFFFLFFFLISANPETRHQLEQVLVAEWANIPQNVKTSSPRATIAHLRVNKYSHWAKCVFCLFFFSYMGMTVILVKFQAYGCNGFHRIIGPVNAYTRPSCHFCPCFHVCLCFQNRPLPTLTTYLHLLYQLFASITFQFSGCNSFQKITF